MKLQSGGCRVQIGDVFFAHMTSHCPHSRLQLLQTSCHLYYYSKLDETVLDDRAVLGCRAHTACVLVCVVLMCMESHPPSIVPLRVSMFSLLKNISHRLGARHRAAMTAPLVTLPHRDQLLLLLLCSMC